ncbi:type IV secretion system protein [Altericroceibacterium spongiae]|uniref:Type IV secretion system protein n=1 Tax=Altericroceibacterium spongiae TaxID=2320269 RepID=A0A420ER69_9SPHN|nr:type IV secretion system protein [Altericroceibacterium spongiae]RKF23150.1 type IV secretion system protein [Altericroceibacterium spongiae]
MSDATCQTAMENVGGGVAASLHTVDCITNDMTSAAFGRLFGTHGALMPALTILLTLYIAFFAFSLITGRSRIGISSLTPRMITIGLVLTFATSWIAYQGVVWNLATGAPNEIAGILMGTKGSATDIFAAKVDVVFGALIEATGGAGKAGENAASTFSPEGLLWLGGTLLLLGTVGVLVTVKIALAVLLALGPVFVVLALFPATRGLFAGWLKAVVLLALTPLFAVLSGSLMLELSVPVLSALAAVPGQIDPRAAMAFFMIGAVHLALMALVMKTAGTMVGGWNVFGIAGHGRETTAETGPSGSVAVTASAQRASPMRDNRQIRVPATMAAFAANDSGPTQSDTQRTTRIITGGSAGQNGSAPATSSIPLSRAKGVGSRFRASPARFSEKLK